MSSNWKYCETRKELERLMSGRKIYIYHLGNGGALWILVTRKAVLDALKAHRVYELNYMTSPNFKGYRTLFLDL